MELIPDLVTMMPSWVIAMRAERKSPRTIKSYTAGVRDFLRWCETASAPPVLAKATVQAFMADQLDGGAEPNTVRAKAKGLRSFSAWAASEGEIPEDGLAILKLPRADAKVVSTLTEEQLGKLIKACAGKALRDRRDEAIIRLLAETGARASELVDIQTTDVDLASGAVTITRGKGGKGRVVGVGPQTTLALDRYLRARRAAGHPEEGPLWYSKFGALTYDGLDYCLKQRAKAAGITGIHCHKMRHTFATRWKGMHGSDDGLMAVAGWSSRTMIDRYTKTAVAERALTEHRALGLGDL